MTEHNPAHQHEHVKTFQEFVGVAASDVFDKTRGVGDWIQDMTDAGHFQYRRTIVGQLGREVRAIDLQGESRDYLMFGSNSYLGMTSHPRVIEAARSVIATHGTGAGGSPILSGTTDVHEQLQQRIAEFKGCEAALVFPSGYAANVGLITALARPGDILILDSKVHASVVDGSRMSGADIVTFRHNDADDLARVLGTLPEEAGKVVLVEGVYSMDGDICDLPHISEIAKLHGARLIIDEAHATGVIGPGGRGTAAHFGNEHKPDLTMGTFSKALGSVGGWVAGDADVIDYLRIFARAGFFSTGLPPAQAAASLAALDLLMEQPELAETVMRNGDYLRERLAERGYLALGETAIVPVVLGDAAAFDIGNDLDAHGIYANVVPYPAVPRGKARVRLTVMATHTIADLDAVVAALDYACVGREIMRSEAALLPVSQVDPQVVPLRRAA